MPGPLNNKAYKFHEGQLIYELKQYDLDAEAIEHICKIIANHHNLKDADTTEFRIVLDADRLVNIYEDYPDEGEDKLKEIIG